MDILLSDNIDIKTLYNMNKLGNTTDKIIKNFDKLKSELIKKCHFFSNNINICSIDKNILICRFPYTNIHIGFHSDIKIKEINIIINNKKTNIPIKIKSCSYSEFKLEALYTLDKKIFTNDIYDIGEILYYPFVYMDYEIIFEENINEIINLNEHIKCIYCELTHNNNVLLNEFFKLLNMISAFY